MFITLFQVRLDRLPSDLIFMLWVKHFKRSIVLYTDIIIKHNNICKKIFRIKKSFILVFSLTSIISYK